MGAMKLKHILNCHQVIKTDISKGEKVYLYDREGRRYVDFESGIWCAALGYSNERINSVMVEQIRDITHLHHALTSDIAEELAINLLKLFHFKDGKAVFLSSGSEAVGLALRIARLVSGEGRMLTFAASYLSAYAGTGVQRDKNLWAEVDFTKCSGCTSAECSGDCGVLKDIDFHGISSFILEPAACGRVLFPPCKLVKFLSGEVKSRGGLIVANEVTTGFGRTGKWFGYNHYNVKPDIVALGKALGNGYPVSGVVMDGEIAERVEATNFVYAQSHQNDPLGCRIAKEVINIMREGNVIKEAEDMGEYFMMKLQEVQKSSPLVREVRGRGAMLAVELNINGVVTAVQERMLEVGYFIGTTPTWNVLRFFPALSIAREDICQMCEELKEVLKVIEREAILGE